VPAFDDPMGPDPTGVDDGPRVQPEPRPGPDPGAKAAIRTLRLLAAGLFMVLFGTAVFVTANVLRDDEAPPTTTTRVRRIPPSTLAPGAPFTEVGPARRVEIDPYVRERRQALARAEGDLVAVVSLRAYASEDAARSHAGDLEVLALLVAAPGGSPSVVEGPLTAWADERRRADVEERDNLRQLAATTDDPAFKADFEAEVARLNKAIEAIDPEGDVVFGLVVRAPVADLQALDGRRDVRLVDVATSNQPESDVDYRGLRPEETSRAQEPPTRTLPAAPRPVQ